MHHLSLIYVFINLLLYNALGFLFVRNESQKEELFHENSSYVKAQNLYIWAWNETNQEQLSWLEEKIIMIKKVERENEGQRQR